MLLTMPDLVWTVRVKHWKWVYSFSHVGLVNWRDPFNGMRGNGNWKKDKGKLITRWVNSKTWEEWDLPINPDGATGRCHMTDGIFDLQATAENYYLQPGDVVKSGGKQFVIYPDEVRSGGTVAWVCRNPGAIRDGDKYGAYPGKKYQTQGAGSFAIFPDESTGIMAVVSILRVYGRVTITQAMRKYAPKGDGKNDPDKYARILAAGLKLSPNTFLTDMSDEQVMRMADLITGVEHAKKGTTYTRDDEALPQEVRDRLK